MDIVNEYLKNNINFIICYPEEICLEEYKNRFLKKGNSKDYIKMKINEYYEKVKYLNQYFTYPKNSLKKIQN